MRGKWGTIWLAALIVTCSLMCAPLTARATDTWDRGSMPFTLVGAQTPMEAQMLGEKPFQPAAPPNAGANLLSKFNSSLLPRNLEMHISVLYNREPAPIEPLKGGEASMLMRYSLDYRLLPNLKVGLNAYLYRPDSSDNLSLARPFGDQQIMGVGPGIKYDLGRWSFMVKSQMEAGNRDQRADGLQNWFRVWYAF